jgi:hypothetical protein
MMRKRAQGAAAPEPEEFVGYLERDQLETETDKPLAPAQLSARTKAGLWALRVFVLVVSVMVIFTFVSQLH